MPDLGSFLWSKKCMVYFDEIDDMKRFIADQRNRFCRFIGKGPRYNPHDVTLSDPHDFHLLTGWKNCHSVILDGNIIGYCGE
jgi:hypothetical protein